MSATATLTKRENEIAEMIAWGATKKEVAMKLHISVRTVENTARSIYEKLGVTKSNELSAWWFCTVFKISSDLSPLRDKIAALALLFRNRAILCFSKLPFDFQLAVVMAVTIIVIRVKLQK